MPTDPFDPFTPALDLAAAVRRRELGPVELAEGYLRRADRLDPVLNAFCFRDDGAVLAAARAAERRVLAARAGERLPPFLGVPLPVKDLADVAGWPTTYGSLATPREPAAATDPAVGRLLAAGFVPMGKTTTSEFGALPFTESPALGVTRNPWDTDRTPGGSSSGAGAAVAAALAPLAHAEDGGGSIRIPASCTGLVGLKPTRGRVAGATVLVEGLATSGAVTRTVEDTAAVLDALARHDPGSWWSPPDPARPYAAALEQAPPTGLRIGHLTDSPVDGIAVDPACRTAVDAALRALEHAGHHLVDTPLPLPPAAELVAAFTAVWNTGAAAVPLTDPELVEPHNRALREAAHAVDSWAYARAVQSAQRLSRRLVEGFLAGFDLLVTPTMACLPPRIGAWRTGTAADPGAAVRNSYPMGVFTSVFNVTGQPAISLPLHRDAATGLPVGVQLVAAPWREDLLLQVARTLEEALPWAGHRPPVGR
ncbi:amidase [Kitasatospora phosalacinea]|uniref:6-aminohexanoate-cyclic-dimer hydrolase n=1 Tax=Kitasatospora phosalacinea TaxID=2065 RepID=A0A9W6PIM8_9ACTN|nr:amidase [Kitasatospora phosalacinea]GLW55624.1 6-aminohexanoate-cyclic-dimer hydrolase [Kitasatospora phosalacinea]